MSAAVFEERSDPGEAASLVLALAVHLALFAVLVFGVRWQNRPPDVVNVELWEAPVPAPVVEAPPPPKVEPAPPPPPPRPEPVIRRPDIAVKAPPPPKPLPKVAPKPAPPAVPKVNVAEAQRRMREELAREQQSIAIDRERAQIREQLARDATAASNRALASWIDKIKVKIRNNIVAPKDIPGNPEAIFDVVQLPTGEVLSIKLRKSSGHRAYDEAVERAILKSSPLPKPDRPELFQRALELKFRPLDPI